MATISTRTVTLNLAFLREIKEDNRELRNCLATLRAVLSRARLVVSRRELVQLIGLLRDQLALHFSLEEAYGYFDDPISVAPQLSARISMVRGQHSELFLQVVSLEDLAEQWLHHEHGSVGLRRIAWEFSRFDAQFQRHEHVEHELMQEAFYDEFGVGD